MLQLSAGDATVKGPLQFLKQSCMQLILGPQSSTQSILHKTLLSAVTRVGIEHDRRRTASIAAIIVFELALSISSFLPPLPRRSELYMGIVLCDWKGRASWVLYIDHFIVIFLLRILYFFTLQIWYIYLK